MRTYGFDREVALLCAKGCCRRIRYVLLQRAMHPLMPDVSLRPTCLYPLMHDPWPFEQSKLEEPAESIRQDGLIQLIPVRPNTDGFEIVAGVRRFRAAQLAKTVLLPAAS